MARVATPARSGTILALVSAVAFGATTPLVQRLGRDVGPFATAALLYAGASVVGIVTRSRTEAPVRRANAARVVLVAALGAGIAPALLAWGLARASGASSSLMLNLEGVFTLALARLVHGEHVGRRVAAAAAILLVGGALLVFDRSGASAAAPVAGLVAVALASFAWAMDNTFAKPLSSLDPAGVVAWKGLVGATMAMGCALLLGERWPAASAALGLAVVGATGYGLSLRLYLRAQRTLGAGRTASVFATAPFCGALLAWGLGERFGGLALLGALAMVVGLVLHLTEHHAHAHVHESVEHDHAHRHDDGHHDHVHVPMPEGEHAHPHRHARMVHDHDHVPDIHHEHPHEHPHPGERDDQ